MAKPTIYRIGAFDAERGTTVSFAFDGFQVFGNELIIFENDHPENIVYQRRTESMNLRHTIIPQNALYDLKNGGNYICRVKVFDVNGQESELSEYQQFYCFTTPRFVFKSLNIDENIIKNSYYNFEVDCSQSSDSTSEAIYDDLNIYYVELYTSGKSLIKKSPALYYAASDEHKYKFDDFESGTSYYVRAYGETIHGMAADTGYIPFSTDYVKNPFWAMIDLQNNESDGTILISSNAVSVTGAFSGDGELEYVSHHSNAGEADLRPEGYKITFDRNEFILKDEYAVRVIGSCFVNGETVLRLQGNEGELCVKYIEGYFNSAGYPEPCGDAESTDEERRCAYFVLRVIQGLVVYTIISDILPCPFERQIVIDLSKKGTLYGLRCRFKE